MRKIYALDAKIVHEKKAFHKACSTCADPGCTRSLNEMTARVCMDWSLLCSRHFRARQRDTPVTTATPAPTPAPTPTPASAPVSTGLTCYECDKPLTDLTAREFEGSTLCSKHYRLILKIAAGEAQPAPAPAPPPSGPGICPVCTRKVYPLDSKTTLEGQDYHTACFKCSDCSKTLSHVSARLYNSLLLCSRHYRAHLKADVDVDDTPTPPAPTTSTTAPTTARTTTERRRPPDDLFAIFGDSHNQKAHQGKRTLRKESRVSSTTRSSTPSTLPSSSTSTSTSTPTGRGASSMFAGIKVDPMAFAEEELCPACGKPTSGRCAKLNNAVYHKACVACATCRKQLTSKYVSHDGAIYCPSCSPARTTRSPGPGSVRPGDKCSQCWMAIGSGDQVLATASGPVHVACYLCSECGVNLQGKSDVAVHPGKGYFYCNRCLRTKPLVLLAIATAQKKAQTP